MLYGWTLYIIFEFVNIVFSLYWAIRSNFQNIFMFAAIRRIYNILQEFIYYAQCKCTIHIVYLHFAAHSSHAHRVQLYSSSIIDKLWQYNSRPFTELKNTLCTLNNSTIWKHKHSLYTQWNDNCAIRSTLLRKVCTLI